MFNEVIYVCSYIHTGNSRYPLMKVDTPEASVRVSTFIEYIHYAYVQ